MKKSEEYSSLFLRMWRPEGIEPSYPGNPLHEDCFTPDGSACFSGNQQLL